ncbi:metallophosphoesterase [Carpediemonas membranifera]|uniref:Metallophosphoesterase n=1 Tax=Carpediemonas membranifera TaxID=201153 RepID=A0A8J6E9J7_9EUKA|nr:metallophosphoesterase [Carpediemonas membranifera]|eukprot:KAG9393445.1 metallophosphoesterase [Carpediemonas membranifera]
MAEFDSRIAIEPANLLEGASNSQNRNVVRVISDLHLGSHWHTSENSKALSVCLDECLDPATFVKALVVGGDILEQWLVPHHTSPPNVVDVLRQTNVFPVIEKLRAVSKNGVQVYYIRGNHDDELDTPSLREVFGDDLIIVEGEELCFNGMRFQHGHYQDLLSMPYEGAKFQRPASYYMSRLAAASGNMQDRPNPGWLNFSWLAGNRFFTYFLTLFYFKPVTKYFMRMTMTISYQKKWHEIKDERVQLRNGNSLSLSEIVTEYSDLIWYAMERYGPVRTAAMFRMSLSGNVGHWMRRSPYLIEVAGHSHIPMLRSYMRYKSLLSDGTKAPRTLPTKVIYANSGSFTGGESTYVDILLSRTSHEVGWRSYLPPYLFGLEHPRDNRSYYENYKGEPTTNVQPHSWDPAGSINDPARLTQQESGVAAGTVVPYEVRMAEWRDGGFYIRKAKRVPYRFDPTSFNRRKHAVNKYDVPIESGWVTAMGGARMGVPVTSVDAGDMWGCEALQTSDVEDMV